MTSSRARSKSWTSTRRFMRARLSGLRLGGMSRERRDNIREIRGMGGGIMARVIRIIRRGRIMVIRAIIRRMERSMLRLRRIKTKKLK